MFPEFFALFCGIQSRCSWGTQPFLRVEGDVGVKRESLGQRRKFSADGKMKAVLSSHLMHSIN